MSKRYRFEYLSALEIGELVNKSLVKPTEVVTYFLKRIKELNPKLNAFVYVKPEEALAEAKKLEERLSRGEKLGPFAGVPFCLKDFLPSKKGWSASHGGVRSIFSIDEYDSEFCKAMERAGGIAIGKTNAPAFGFRGTCDNKLYGATRNPFDPTRNSGGSSGGTASAVAGGLVPIGEGGDAGGSIRIPASWCNLFGFKASAGLIPNVCRPDAWAASHPFCTGGGLTKTVEDAANLLNYMVAYDPHDPWSVDLPKVDYVSELKKPMRKLRIAYTPDFGIFPVEKEMLERTKDAAMRLKELGHDVQEIGFPFHEDLQKVVNSWLLSISFDTAIELKLWKSEGKDLLKDHKDELSESFIHWNKQIYESNEQDLYEFNKIRTSVLDAFLAVFEEFDLVLSPVTACLPVKNADDTLGPEEINGIKVDRNIGFAETLLVNFIGYPAASVPCGFSSEGLPIGLHVIGKKWHDKEVLRLSKQMQDRWPWRNAYPER